MLNTKQINTKITGIKKTGATLRASIQEVMCNIAGHVYEHGDTTMYAKLFEASTGLNKKKIVKWIHEYGFARLQADGSFKPNAKMKKETMFGNGADEKDSGAFVVEYLTTESNDWWADEESAQAILKALDVTSSILGLVKRIDKAVEKGQEIESEDVQGALRILGDKVESIAA